MGTDTSISVWTSNVQKTPDELIARDVEFTGMVSEPLGSAKS